MDEPAAESGVENSGSTTPDPSAETPSQSSSPSNNDHPGIDTKSSALESANSPTKNTNNQDRKSAEIQSQSVPHNAQDKKSVKTSDSYTLIPSASAPPANFSQQHEKSTPSTENIHNKEGKGDKKNIQMVRIF